VNPKSGKPKLGASRAEKRAAATTEIGRDLNRLTDLVRDRDNRVGAELARLREELAQVKQQFSQFRANSEGRVSALR